MASSTQPPSTVPPMLRIVATNEKVTGPAGLEMLRRSGITETLSGDLNILDNACGGGILTADLLASFQQNPSQKRLAHVTAADLDDRMVAYTADRKLANSWSNVDVTKQDQQQTSFPNGIYTHVFNNFGIFFAKDPTAALTETLRILRPRGGVAGFTSWRSIRWWPTLAEPALAKYMPDAPKLPHPTTLFAASGWNDASKIADHLEKAGFVDVEVAEYSFTPNVGPEEFAEACAVLAKAAAKAAWSAAELERYGDKIAPAFLEYLLQNYPGGRWNDQMTAIISLGRKP